MHDLQKCHDSFPFARVVTREWAERVEKERRSSTEGFECQLSISRFRNPYVPIPTRTSKPSPTPGPSQSFNRSPISLTLSLTLA